MVTIEIHAKTTKHVTIKKISCRLKRYDTGNLTVIICFLTRGHFSLLGDEET